MKGSWKMFMVDCLEVRKEYSLIIMYFNLDYVVSNRQYLLCSELKIYLGCVEAGFQWIYYFFKKDYLHHFKLELKENISSQRFG